MVRNALAFKPIKINYITSADFFLLVFSNFNMKYSIFFRGFYFTVN